MKSITQKLEQLGSTLVSPSVTISLNTHRTHPENEQDRITLKKLLQEAIDRVIEIYGKRPAAVLLDKLESIEKDIDINYNLESMHLFLSDNTQEVIRTTWPVSENSVFVGEHFLIRPLIKAANRLEEYYILELSLGGVHLYEALSDQIAAEVKNEDFPFESNPHYITHADKASDAKHVDNQVREYFNKVDKAAVRAHRETGLGIVVISTKNNYNVLLQVADEPNIYIAHAAINYNETKPHDLSSQAWEEIQKIQFQRRTDAISELQQAVGDGKVITDLTEIYQAALDGRGDLLVVNMDYTLPVVLTDERNFELTDDLDAPGVDSDIISTISWNVRSKGGKVVYTNQELLNDFGKIALKVRYS